MSEGAGAVQPISGRTTGIGSMPGSDPLESARIVVGESASLPSLPELPARGAGADMIGRTASLLDGIAVGLVPSGWRVLDRPGADIGRARSWLAQDLDAFEEACSEHRGSVKIQVVGPWTLAAGLELASGEAMLRDHGARRDLVTSLSEGIQRHVGEVRRRLGDDVDVVVQIDEPMIDFVHHGRVPTASGWATYRGLDVAEVRSGLARVVEAARAGGSAGVTIHSCDQEPSLELMVEAGADGLSFDLALVGEQSLDTLAAAVENGLVLLPGVIDPIDDVAWAGAIRGAGEPTGRGDRRGPPVSAVMDTVDRVQRWWSVLGFGSRAPMNSLALTPTCGLAGADPQRARAVLERLRQVAQALEEDPDGDHSRR